MHSDPICIRKLVKRYGDSVALSVDEFDLVPGGRYAIIGPNGAGKSTLIRILAGTLDATEGDLGLPNGCRIGYLPQHPFIFDVSVWRNVAMATEKGLSREQRDERVEESLRVVDMLDLANARGSQLSGGEAQRVALARLFVKPFDMLLLDEPTSAMDIRGTIAVEEALSCFLKQSNATLLVSTHAPAQALRISDHVIFLNDGQLVEQGESAELINNPQTDAAREFLSYWRI